MQFHKQNLSSSDYIYLYRVIVYCTIIENIQVQYYGKISLIQNVLHLKAALYIFDNNMVYLQTMHI